MAQGSVTIDTCGHSCSELLIWVFRLVAVINSGCVGWLNVRRVAVEDEGFEAQQRLAFDNNARYFVCGPPEMVMLAQSWELDVGAHATLELLAPHPWRFLQ